MNTEDYEYRGLIAQTWDLLRGDYSAWPDRLFYRAIIEQRSGPALDVGCGTGRLLLDYLAAGFDVDGVDNSPEMLAICRAKAEALGIDVEGRLHEQAMESMALGRQYATILVPSLTFQLLTDEALAERAMARFYNQLAPNGMLVVSFNSKLWTGKQTPTQLQWSNWQKVAESPRSGDGVIVRRWTRERYDHRQQLQYEENRYEVALDDIVLHTELHARSPSVRWYSQSQGIACFERAGFINLRTTSGDSFDRTEADETRFKISGLR
jgi:SAM-dependent methyltransferase